MLLVEPDRLRDQLPERAALRRERLRLRLWLTPLWRGARASFARHQCPFR
jgi:hypothetical protein